jgi:phosphoserine phosphatase
VSKLAAFDMDGVLVDIVSSWVHVHRQFGVNNDHSLFAYLRGEIDDREFIRRDIALWKEADPDVTSAKIRSMLATAPIMTGAAELMAELKRRGFSTAIVSAGIDLLSERVAEELAMDLQFANGLLTDASDRLTGEGVFRVRLMDKGSKVSEAARELGVRHEDIVSVGNSRYDVSMFEHSAFGIAFCPEDDHVKEKADAVVVEKDLRKVLEHLDGF